MNSSHRLAVIALSALAALGRSEEPLRMDLRSTFMGPGAGTEAVTVTLTNDGPAVHGALRVLGAQDASVYPVALRPGERRRILTLNQAEPWATLRFVLDTDRGRIVEPLASNPTPIGETFDNGRRVVRNQVALIGLPRGGLDFERDLPATGRYNELAAYVLPKAAPDRAAAYQAYTAVVLGPQAVAISDATVRSLKEYALAGGKLVFVGGAGPSPLDDSRWADLLPGQGWEERRVSDAPLKGEATVRVPRALAPGASKTAGEPYETTRGYGLGRVVVFGDSPFDLPRASWSREGGPLSRAISRTDGKQYANAYLEHSGVSDDGESGVADDPFRAKLPPTAVVFGILAAYFVAVVPASFLVLRKLKRGELAWVTAPLLSLGFAALLFRSAQSLYAAALSTASQGLVVLQEGRPEGMFFGTSQMFFPKGGTYDLRLENVDRLAPVQQVDYGSDALAGFDPVDDGQVRVPRLQTDNLAFREMAYAQRLPHADWFRIDPVDARRTVVENRSPYAFRGALYTGLRRSARVELAPGERKTVDVGTFQYPIGSPKIGPRRPVRPGFSDADDRIALMGGIEGFRPGPQIGQAVRSEVSVLVFAQEAAR